MRCVLFLLLLLHATAYRAQNLVPNGSFEEHDTCPEFFGYAQYATGWSNLHTNSADYFNRCQENLVAGVPFNTCGYQEPADGDAYVGLITTFPGLDWYREIVSIELTEPLQAGVPICLSFKMALGGFGSWDGNSAMYTAKGVGLRFFNQFPADWPAYLYPNTAALYLDEVLTDTAVWYTVSGEYLPDSNYTHIAIGNFFADSLSDISDLDTSGYGTAGVSYAFIDDVRVSYELAYCGSTGVRSVPIDLMVHVFPNPFLDRFTVSLAEAAHGTVRWQLLDAYGQQVRSGSTTPFVKDFVVRANALTQGTYLLQMYDSAGTYASARLVSLSP